MSEDPILAAIASLRLDLLSEVGGLRVQLGNHMERVEDKLNTIRDDIAVNFGNTDAVRRANDNTRDEARFLADTVAIMQRQILRLENQIDLLLKDRK